MTRFLKSRWGVLLWLSVAVASLLYPFKTTSVPAWTLRVVDENEKPYAGLTVRQSWKNYTLDHEAGEHIEDAVTDDNGYVTFPERTLSFSLLGRIIRTLFAAAMTIAHGGFGTRADVFVGRENFFRSVRYEPGKPLPDKLIIPAEEFGAPRKTAIK